jgi:shikimate kinase
LAGHPELLQGPRAIRWADAATLIVELDKEVEKEAGARLGEVFAMYGQDAYRRFERRALERVLRTHEAAVIAAGGSLVTAADTYKQLLARCFCVWLKTRPEEHMARVIAQGDMRPFKGRSAALDEIKKLPGIKHAFLVDAAGQGNNSLASGVAIVADSWWLANDARRTLKVTWSEGPTAVESTAGYLDQCKEMATRVAATPPTVAGQGGAAIGDVEAGFKSAAKIVEAEYYFPLLSHAPLEPQNSLAHYRSKIELDTMRTIKRALDPKGIMNPGKVVRA